MRFLPLLLPLLFLPELFAHAARPDRLSAYPRLDRRDRLGGGKSGPLLSMALTATGASECDGATPSGLTFTRASSATCTRSDGTVVHLSANQPRVSARGLLVEGAATNLVLHSSELAQAAWTKGAGITCLFQLDPGGNYTRCTNGGGTTATVLQTLTTAAATRATSMRLRGTAEVTRDGVAFAAVSPASWQRVAPSCLAGDAHCIAVPALSSGIANPVVGFRLAPGNSVDVALVQDEAGAYATSPIVTAGTSATRAADVASVAVPGISETVGCAAMTIQPPWTGGNPYAGSGSYFLSGDINPTTSRIAYVNPGNDDWRTFDGAAQTFVAAGWTAGVGKRFRTEWEPGRLQTYNVTDALSGAPAGSSGYSSLGGRVRVGSTSGSSASFSYLSNLVLNNTTTGCSQ